MTNVISKVSKTGKRCLVLTLLFIGLAACNSTRTPESALITLSTNNQVYFDGLINDVAYLNLKAILQTPETNIDTLVISSGGGEIFSGMKIGNLVHDYGLAVVVSNICFSSCANYIATASHQVTIKEGASIGWHGGALQPFYSRSKISFEEPMVKDWQRVEEAFFEKVGVNQAITVLGMMPGVRSKRDALLFTYDTNTLLKLGMNITFEGQRSLAANDRKGIVQYFAIDDDALDMLLTLNEKVQAMVKSD